MQTRGVFKAHSAKGLQQNRHLPTIRQLNWPESPENRIKQGIKHDYSTSH
jgi:hypothetical protein